MDKCIKIILIQFGKILASIWTCSFSLGETLFRLHELMKWIKVLVAFAALVIINSQKDDDVAAQWSKVEVSVKRNQRQVLKLGPGALYIGRLVGMLGPSGRFACKLFTALISLTIIYVSVGSQHF